MSLTDSQFAAVRQALHTYFANDDDDDDAELLSSCYVPATDSDQNTVYMLNVSTPFSCSVFHWTT